MRRSRITSLLGIISLILQICSYIIIPNVDSVIAFGVFFIGGLIFTIIFIIPSIFLSYFKVRFPSLSQKELKRKWISYKRIAAAESPAGVYFSVGYGLMFLMLGSIMGATMFYEAPPKGSPILGLVLVILSILTGILGIVAALVYRDKKSPKKPFKFLCKKCGNFSNTRRGYCKKCGAQAWMKGRKI
jgi:hypothetical protein